MVINITIDDRIIAWIKKALTGRGLCITIIVIALASSAAVYSAGNDVLHFFKEGDVISAELVNANFTALNERIQELEAMIGTNGISGVPAGTIAAFAGKSDQIPEGWYPCDGRIVNRFDDFTGKPTPLFKAIGVSWGGGNGVSNYNIPDLRGVFLRGSNRIVDEIRSDGYRDEDFETRVWENIQQKNLEGIGSFQVDSFESHNHLINDNIGVFINYDNGGTTDGWFLNGGGALNTHNTGSAETRPKNAAVHYIIKY